MKPFCPTITGIYLLVSARSPVVLFYAEEINYATILIAIGNWQMTDSVMLVVAVCIHCQL